jgi:elongation factor P
VAQKLASLHHLLLRIGGEALKKAFTSAARRCCAATIAAKLLRYNWRLGAGPLADRASFRGISTIHQGALLFMAIPATQMRPGMIIKHNNELHAVFSVEHRTPGNLRAFIQAKLRNLRTGAMFEHRFRSPDPIERVIVDEISMDFLYSDGDDYYFMNTENYEQTHLKRDTLGDSVEYLIPNLQIRVSFFDGVAVGIELPQTVEMTVIQTEPGLKSATASSVTKPATLETGLVVQVPPFINEGEKIRVDTAEGAYLSRA